MAPLTSYASLTEIKAAIDRTGSGDDTRLTALLKTASRAVDGFCNRPDGFRATSDLQVRRYPGSGGTVQWIDECVAISLVEVKEGASDDDYTAWGSGDWLAGRGDPLTRPDFNTTPYEWLMVDPTGDEDHFTSGQYSGRRGFQPSTNGGRTRSVPTVRVTARWGYADANLGPIKEATIIIAARMYKRGQSAYADTLASGEMGQLMYRKVIDPDVAMLLKEGHFIRPSVG